MQALKEKIQEKVQDYKEMREAKAEAKEQEKAEREYAKARQEVAREVRLAKEREAEMDYHIAKAADKAFKHEAKLSKDPLADDDDDVNVVGHPPSATILGPDGNPISR